MQVLENQHERLALGQRHQIALHRGKGALPHPVGVHPVQLVIPRRAKVQREQPTEQRTDRVYRLGSQMSRSGQPLQRRDQIGRGDGGVISPRAGLVGAPVQFGKMRGQHIRKQPVRRPQGMFHPATFEPERCRAVRCKGRPPQLRHQSRLADPGLTDDGDDLPLARQRLGQGRLQLRQFVIAPHQFGGQSFDPARLDRTHTRSHDLVDGGGDGSPRQPERNRRIVA